MSTLISNVPEFIRFDENVIHLLVRLKLIMCSINDPHDAGALKRRLQRCTVNIDCGSHAIHCYFQWINPPKRKAVIL